MPDKTERVVLITGGHGFIGSNVAKKLYQLYKDESTRIRIVDIAPTSTIEGPLCHEFIQADICDVAVCRRVVRGVDTVLHFAANTGGIESIQEQNDFAIYRENHAMTLNLLEAAAGASVKTFLYASSACVYPEQLQSNSDEDGSLTEFEVLSRSHSPSLSPKPQSMYGCEKLVSEAILAQFASKMDVRIARLDDVFGPGGSWNDGRENSPEALLRKAIVLSYLPNQSDRIFEIWGDGSQRRSFLYIDDAVDGIVSLMNSTCTAPVNIGSDRSVSIKDLALMVLNCAGIDPSTVRFEFDADKPAGVAWRNSTSDAIGWRPSVTLEEGLARTRAFIEERLKSGLDSSIAVPSDFMKCKTVFPNYALTKFAILLPISPSDADLPEVCLENLRVFARSLYDTTWRDLRSTSGARFEVRVYLAVDHDDDFLGRAEDILLQENITSFTTVVCSVPRRHVCSLWRECARRAYTEGADFMVLMSGAMKLHDEGWMRQTVECFKNLSIENKVPFGIGCVAFTDITFPGIPTFPILHKTHLDIFKGEVVPSCFIDQDGDEFLFQLYRRWGCSTLFQSRISNGVGGKSESRYEKIYAKDWSFPALGDSVLAIADWLLARGCAVEQKLTIDVIVPSFRVLIHIIDGILKLKSPSTCSVMFIIIIDNPISPNIDLVTSKYIHRPDVRIRVNSLNMGVSFTRNRGMRESTADWIHFLDDDVVPGDTIFFNDERIIRAHPKTAGFVARTIFPIAESVFTTAVHLSAMTYFWDISLRIEKDIPWGVTANLIMRRMEGGVEFDLLSFPKLGGGEDIDFCLKQRRFSIETGGEGFVAAPDVVATHPWWGKGVRSYWHFYNWSYGDGILIKLYPQHSFRDYTPNTTELAFACGLAIVFACLTCNLCLLTISITYLTALLLANIMHDGYRHFWRYRSWTNTNTNVGGLRWLAAVVEGSLIRMFNESGRTVGHIKRREWSCFGKRFDWFAGRNGTGPVDYEIRNGIQRFSLSLVIFFVLHWFGNFV